MSVQLFNLVSFIFFIFPALMVMIRFVFYRRDQELRSVYFWGGCMFGALGVFDLVSDLCYDTGIHPVQTTVFFILTVLMMVRAAKKQGHVVSVHA